MEDLKKKLEEVKKLMTPEAIAGLTEEEIESLKKTFEAIRKKMRENGIEE